MARIGIFGGRFDPPHLGHINAVSCFHDTLDLDKVIVIPTGISPHKTTSLCSASTEDRYKMTKLAFNEFQYVEVSDDEIKRDTISYTYETILRLRDRFIDDQLYFLVGSDMYLSFETWYHPEIIAQNVTLCVIERNINDLELFREHELVLRDKLNLKTRFIEGTVLPCSSTSVRAMLAFKCGEKYITPAVYQYIISNKLYYSCDNLSGLSFDRLKEVSLSLHNPNRVNHVIGCSHTAYMLAKKYGADPDAAARAGILHDITKALNAEEQLHLCRNYAIVLTQFEEANPKLLHAKTGAYIAQRIFGESDLICDGIYWHTTGCVNMTVFEKIIYIADYMEPNRKLEGVETLRKLAEQDLDQAVLMGLEMSISYLNSKKSKIDPNSMGAYLDLKERIQNVT